MTDSGWESQLEAKHGMPLEQIPGTVYALHYDTPQTVRSVSRDYAGPNPQTGPKCLLSAPPIRHYVGWTQQRNPRGRIYDHGPIRLAEVVELMPGTMLQEQWLKLN